MRLIAELNKLQSRFNMVKRSDLAEGVHWSGAQKLPVHRWFRYREGYSPSLFKQFPHSKRRLDPFCGCGTTLLSSASAGVESFGIDLNPLATFIAKVKTRSYTTSEHNQFISAYKKSLTTYRRFEPTEQPEYELLSKLFLPDSLNTLLKLDRFIATVSNSRVRDLLKLAWLSIVEDASNAFKEGNGLKYRNKLRRPGKYVTVDDSVWIPKYFGKSVSDFVLGLWESKCSTFADDMPLLISKKMVEPEIRTGSCLDAGSTNFGRKVDLAIFSPPYANRFDYFEAFKMELWLGRFVTNRSEMATLRGRSMRNNLSSKLDGIETDWQPLGPFLDAMDDSASSVRMGIKDTLKGYFTDTRRLLRNLQPSLYRGGRVVIVVGNSAYAKSIIPTDVLVGMLGVEEGYKVETINVARTLHVSSQQRSTLSHVEKYMRESIIVLSR